MDPQTFQRQSGFYGASQRLSQIGGCILFPTQETLPRESSEEGLFSDFFTGPQQSGGDQTPTVCEDGTLSNQIRVKVIYYDALAVAGGVYSTFGATAQDAEKDAPGIKVRIGTTDVNTNGTGDVTFDNLTDPTCEITLPDLRDTGTGAVYTSLHSECGTISTNDSAIPRHRKTYHVTKGALYTLRIWLRPKSLVLHWTAGARRISDTPRSFYPFLISGGGDRQLGGRVSDDPRLWRHNLYFRGLPENAIQGLAGNNLSVHNTLGGARSVYYRWNEAGENAQGQPQTGVRAKTHLISVNNVGYAMHAGNYNTNTVGVSVCAMSGAVLNGAIGAGTAITNAQADGLISLVADICNAWHMDASDPNEVCTHFEVEHLFHNPARTNRKWDITWLPAEKQNDYRAANNSELCATAATPLTHAQHIDVNVGAGYPSGETETDRVSAYLRELITAAM